MLIRKGTSLEKLYCELKQLATPPLSQSESSADVFSTMLPPSNHVHDKTVRKLRAMQILCCIV